MKDSFASVHEISKQATLLSSIESLLEWDMETYMPSSALSLRAQQSEILAHLSHKARTSPKFAKALSKLIDIETGEIKDDKLSFAQISACKAWRRDYLQQVLLPPAFVKSFSKTTSSALHVWAKARKEDAFHLFAPHLEKIVSLCRKKADLLGFKEHPYDALIDLYEPEAKVSWIEPLFTQLKLPLTSLLKEIRSKPPVNDSFLKGDFPKQQQLQFGEMLMKAMGLDSSFCRLDLSTHPFCTGKHPHDIRMTTRISIEHPMSNIFSVIHEGGHALYSRGLPEKEFGSPLGEDVSLGIHESQSRFWETLIGRSLPFWTHFFPKLQELFPHQLKNVRLQDFYRAINKVEPTLIRVEADEVTYSLHVIIRFEIEKALIEGSLKIREIPEAWNEKMRTYLGISPASNAEGCLQDIHWSMGSIGYFPTYTLGNLYACQFFTAFEAAFPQWKERVAQGELGFIREWLRENIHQYGREFSSEELAQRITKRPLSIEPFIAHLEQKYKVV